MQYPKWIKVLFFSVSLSVMISSTGAAQKVDCRPEGLYSAPGVLSPYCSVYDTNGREKMGSQHTRRIIGYFTAWRNGANGQPSYLVSDIPWEKITHINYAFAHIDKQNRLSVGNTNNPQNPATGMEWPGVPGAEMDPTLSFKGHFNLLNKYKKQYPDVRVLVSVGGWAETGGYFDENGNRIDSGGFYEMTKTSQGIETFADSAVAFLREFGLDGVDIDYEYPTSMKSAGNPDDFWVADTLRESLWRQYALLMKTLREKLDRAGAKDGKHYYLTVAAPGSGYLLRGMEDFKITRYLDYLNIMTYDLHGSWNEFVGHNAPLFDTGKDSELIFWDAYGGVYQNIGYLNTDWGYHYFRGSLPPGRINIGVPMYTRGWQDVTGGTNGLWGTSALPDQTKCPPGTGTGKVRCGYGAEGIDNLWHDLGKLGEEVFAGSNPMWHAKNLENGILPSYLTDYGLDPVNNPQDKLVGTYQRFYDTVAKSPYLWNSQKKVFISTEDDISIKEKVAYVKERGIGGIMFWELAGDYDFDSTKKEYYMGETLVSAIHDGFKTASPYKIKRANDPMPKRAVDIDVDVIGFALGDNNYPISPKLKFTNNTGVILPGGTKVTFNMPSTTPKNIADTSGMGLTVLKSDHTGNNIGGLKGDFHKLSFTFPSWMSVQDGASFEVQIRYYLPINGPSNYVIEIEGRSYAFKYEYPSLPVVPPGPEPEPVPTTEIASDGFETYGWKGGKGAWVGPWKKTGVVKKKSKKPYSGKKYVHFYKNSNLSRVVDLSQATQPKLRFVSRIRSFEKKDRAVVKVSSDGVTFREALVLTPTQSDNIYHAQEIPLSDFAKSNRFHIVFESQTNRNKDYWYIDQVEIIDN